MSNPFAIQQSAPRQLGALAQTDAAKAVAEVQAQLVVAKNFPRDQAAAYDKVMMACRRPKLAAEAVYQYARGGSDITGPSIKLAKAMALSWGNIASGWRVISATETESTVQAYAWDLEANTKAERTFQVPHSRTANEWRPDPETGRRVKVPVVHALTDPRDIYETIANMAARRERACILDLIPSDVVQDALVECEQTQKADVKVTPELVSTMVQVFAGHGVTKAAIEKRIQRKLEAITPALVIMLRRIAQSLKDGMSVAADHFEIDDLAEAAPTVERKTRAEKVTDAVRRAAEAAPAEEPAKDAAPAAPTRAAVLAEAEKAIAEGADAPYIRALLERDGLFDDAGVDGHLERLFPPAAKSSGRVRRGYED